MSDIRLRDRVVMIGPQDGFFTQVPGEVVMIKSMDALVLFEEEARSEFTHNGDSSCACPLHSGLGHAPEMKLPGRCWWTYRDRLKRVSPKPKQLELFQGGES